MHEHLLIIFVRFANSKTACCKIYASYVAKHAALPYDFLLFAVVHKIDFFIYHFVFFFFKKTKESCKLFAADAV